MKVFRRKKSVYVRVRLRNLKYLFVLFVLFGFLIGSSQVLATHNLTEQLNTRTRISSSEQLVQMASYQTSYAGNSEKYSYSDLAQVTDESILVDFPKKTGYIHPLISGFYHRKSSVSNTKSVENIERERTCVENNTSSLTKSQDKYLEYFDLKEKIPEYEGKTYDIDLNNTELPVSKETDTNITTSVTNFMGQMYGTYYMSNSYASSEPEQVYASTRSTTSLEPDTRDFPAPVPIVKDAHWFPKESHARLMYDILVYGTGYVTVKIHVILKSDEDTYSRYFRVYMDSNKIYEKIVCYPLEYNLTITTTVYNYYVQYTPHLLTFEIYWGGQSEHGWKLKYLWIENTPATPPESLSTITGEYFPKLSYSKLSWKVKCGTETKIDVSLKRVNDPISRWFKVFVDDELIFSDILSSGQINFEYHISAGDFSDDSVHTITLQINWGAYADHGWCLEMFRVHHQGFFYEVDYMKGLAPRSDALSYTEEYYKNHGYHRIKFYVDDEVSYRETLTVNEYFDIYAKSRNAGGYFDNYSNMNQGWRYCLYINYPGSDHPNALGLTMLGKYIYIARGYCDAMAQAAHISAVNVERTTLMHEVGHTASIGDFDGSTEVYCSNTSCVMAKGFTDNWIDTPFYCAHHWREREFAN